MTDMSAPNCCGLPLQPQGQTIQRLGTTNSGMFHRILRPVVLLELNRAQVSSVVLFNEIKNKSRICMDKNWEATMAYRLEGRMLEVCTCNAICPCWVGLDPDGGTCEGAIAWHFDKGEIDGTDVSGLTFAVAISIPGNALAGNWRAVAFVDDKANAEQEAAMLAVYTGQKGGPVADLAQLIGEVVDVERAPIKFDVEKGKGTLTIGTAIDAEMEAFEGATGERTTLHDAAFSVIPGAPAYVGRAPNFKASSPALGLDLSLQDKSSVQGSFLFEA